MGQPETLDELPIGQAARVAGVEGGGSMAIRLLEMGLVPGTRVRLIKRAPLGDPIEVQVRGYHISLRKAEARRVRLEHAA